MTGRTDDRSRPPMLDGSSAGFGARTSYTHTMDYLAAMRSFVRTVELGSFTKAAADLGSKVSTVSRYVAALEADLGVALLNRSTRGLKLTEAGKEFLARAASIVADVDEARQATSALNSRPQGALRISLPGAFGRLHVMPTMASFLATHPRIRAEVFITDERVDLIETGTDVAVRIGVLPDSGLQAKRLAGHSRIPCIAHDALAGFHQPSTPADFASLPCVAPATPSERRWYFKADGGTGSVDVNGRLIASDLQALRQAALDGIGIALLPSWLVYTHLREGRLVRLLPAWRFSNQEEFDQGIWAVYPPKKIVSPKVRAFIDHLQTVLRSLPP